MPSWKNSLPSRLNRFREDQSNGIPRTCLVGIGSDLRGDDSAGLAVARALTADERLAGAHHLLVLEGGPAPENHTARIRTFKPELVIFVDAAQMDEPAGTIRWLSLDAIDGMSASTHSLPLSMLARFITLETGCRVAVLGIQPQQNEIGIEITPWVDAATKEIVEVMLEIFAPSGDRKD